MWKNILPSTEEIGCTFGGGTAIIDFEVLFGRNSGKKKRGIKAKISFDPRYDEKKRIHDNNFTIIIYLQRASVPFPLFSQTYIPADPRFLRAP
jgi:hypothetical protein